ncbi:hemolysin family protein [Phocaeicola acetigenes]|jgi:putative hemolysin|uniref:Hemolysin family protein n=1 Tax=Phocaeicola acetigenes TaxID=3016083 RepID=A0ABT4PGA2_9BACT|nr:hemolysin family protein [Phocaeicola sp. KGMB11183]MCZ8372080.1 hemolysin family protein [Phocaeicola sp. KGMB11183]
MDEIFIIIGLIILNGIFAMSEVALISARKSRLSTDAKKGNKAANIALKLANEPDRFLSTVQIGITLIGILTGIYSGNKIAVSLTDTMLAWGVSATYASALAQGVIVVVVTYLTIIFGELVPKRIGLSVAEKAAKLVSRPMNVLSIVASPFVWLLSKSTSAMFNLLGIKDTDSKVTEEEIKSIIQEGTEDGEVQPVEQDIVQRVFLLGDLKIESIMTHKNDIVWLDTEMTPAEVKEVVQSELYEFYPIAEGDLDHVKGVVLLKDLVLHLYKPDFDLASLISEPVYFHEGMNVYKALEQMKIQRVSRALVCDEFGACTGIITLKDILEGLVGTMDNAEEEPDIIKRVNKEGWLVEGQCPFYDFLYYFNRLDLFENSEYNTVGGLILQQLQHIPTSGETIEWNGFTLEVVDMDGARIDKVLVTTTPVREDEGDEEA